MVGNHTVKSISPESRYITSTNSPNRLNTITILHQNLCSLRNKTADLEIRLDSAHIQIDVICLTEHWLNHQNLSRTNISNFKLVSTFNRTYKTHGGSCIYVKPLNQGNR